MTKSEVLNIIGDDIDLQKLLREGRREEYKIAYWINVEKQKMRKRLET